MTYGPTIRSTPVTPPRGAIEQFLRNASPWRLALPISEGHLIRNQQVAGSTPG